MPNISEIYNLTFNRAMYDLPIIASLTKKFRLEVSLRRAIFNEEGGWAEVRLTGTADEVGRAIADLHTTGVQVTGPVQDTINAPDYSQPVAAYVGRGT